MDHPLPEASPEEVKALATQASHFRFVNVHTAHPIDFAIPTSPSSHTTFLNRVMEAIFERIRLPYDPSRREQRW